MKKEALYLCFFLFLGGCQPEQELSTQDSVAQIIENQKIGMEKVSEIHLKENEEDYIGTIQRIRVDANRIYLMDKSHKQILIFSMTGTFIRALGRSGEGPGEFRYLYTMDVKDDLVACFDQGNLRMTLFDTSGVFITSFGTQSRDSTPLGNCVVITPHHTILHCQQPIKLTKEQDVAHNYPWLICEFDTLGNVLSHHGKFNQQIVNRQVIGDKIDKSFTEFKWSFPSFITSKDSQTYLYFYNLPIVVEYDESHAVSKVFNVATPITKPQWVKNEKKLQHLSPEARRELALQRMKSEHSIKTFISDIAYIDKHSLLLVLQTVEERRGIKRTRSYYLSAYSLNSGHRLMTDRPLTSETPIMYQRLAVDAEGFVYCIQSDKPDNFVIAKYKIIREEI